MMFVYHVSVRCCDSIDCQFIVLSSVVKLLTFEVAISVTAQCIYIVQPAPSVTLSHSNILHNV